MRILQGILEFCVALYLITELAIPLIANRPIFPLARSMFGFSDKQPPKE